MKSIRLSRLDIGNTRKTDWLMSAENDFTLRSTAPRLRYLLCSTPRSGSTLVGDILQRSQAAGNPQEYLNARLMAAWLRHKGRLDGELALDEYLHDLESRRTTPNGVFGIKVHFEHLLFLWQKDPAEMASFLRRFDRIVLLTRRDKIAQAVSLYKARVTQIWTSEDRAFLEPDDPRLTTKPAYKPEAIARGLADVMLQEAQWRSTLAQLKFPCEEFVHETFVADMPVQVQRLFGLLELGKEATWTPPQIKRQGSDNDPMLAAFRRDLGLDTPAVTGQVQP